MGRWRPQCGLTTRSTGPAGTGLLLGGRQSGAPLNLVVRHRQLVTAYLDTCIVSGLAKGDLDKSDAEALLHVLEARKLNAVSLVTSEVAKAEIEAVPEMHRGKHQIIYNLLSDVPLAATYRTDSGLMLMGVGGGPREEPLFANLKTVLPDVSDAEHVFQAAKNRVQYLLTTDRPTLIRHAEAIRAICGVDVLSPNKFWALLSQSGDA